MDTFGGENLNGPFVVNESQKEPSKTTDLYGKARNNFIFKVYLVLCIQLLATVVVTAFSMLSQAFFRFQLENMWLFWVAMVTAIVIECYMFCCGGGRTSPSNIVCLSVFTLAEAYIVSFISAITGATQGNGVVLLAAVYTLAVVVACTVYAATTKSDFTASWGMVMILSAVLLVLFIVTLFTSSPLIHNIYCCVGVLLFGLYLIIDTQMILGGRTVELSIDDWGLAAMLLYIDIIQIFLYILQLLSSND